MRWKWMFIGPAAVAGIVLVVFLAGESVKLLWNWLMPPVFGLTLITFWQAAGLLALCRILFGGMRLSGGRYGRSRFRSRYRRRMQERWAAMTPEERERFQAGMSGRCGVAPK